MQKNTSKFWNGVFSLILLLFGVVTKGFSSSIDRVSNTDIATLAKTLGVDPSISLVQETQKRWLRKKGSERFTISPLPEKEKETVLAWAKKHHCYYKWLPQKTSYDTIIILGAEVHTMALRLRFAEKLLLQGIKTNNIVFLTGKRPLRDPEKNFSPSCATEDEAARHLWQTHTISSEIRNLPVRFIALDMKPIGENWERPNTKDTIKAWKTGQNRNLNAKASLFISNQPFCAYQEAVIQSVLGSSPSFEVAGAKLRESHYAAPGGVILDSLARILYERSVFPDKEE